MSARERFDVIGKPRRRVDGRAKVTGQTRFADDIVLPRMLHAKLLRSPHPHARIDCDRHVERGERHPGVHLVLTGKDFPVTFGIMPVSLDEYPLAPERVRYVGDPVAAVIAKDEQTATEALDLIEVEVRDPADDRDPEEALAQPGRAHPRLRRAGQHPPQPVLRVRRRRRGAAKLRPRVRGPVLLRGQHAPADRAARRGRAPSTAKASSRCGRRTQMPHYLHRAARARAADAGGAHPRHRLPERRRLRRQVRLCNHEIVVPKAALMLGRPVKICLNREEVFYLHRGRHPVLMKMRTGVTKDGKLTGMHLQTLLDGGGYGSLRPGEHVLHRRAADGDLRASALQVRGLPRVHQQAGLRPQARPRHAAAALRPGSAARQDRREAGHRSGRAAPEDRRQAELADRELAAASAPSASPNASGRSSRGRTGRTSTASCRPGRGVGIACSAYMCGAGLPIYWNKMPHSGVQLLLDRSGQVTVFCGATEIGQGSDDVLAGDRRRSARHRSLRRALRHRRHRHHAGRPRLLFEPRHRDDGQRRDPGRRSACRRSSPRRSRRAARRDSRPDRVLAGTRVRCRRSREEPVVSRGGRRRRSEVRHARRGRLVLAAEAAGQVQGRAASARRRRTPTRACVVEVEVDARDRLDPRAEDLDRARHRPRAQSRCSRAARSRAACTWAWARR